MAIGIGASLALFTVVRSVLLRPLPFPHPERLVVLYSRGDLSKDVASGDFYDWQKASHGYDQMSIWRWTGYNMSGAGGELSERRHLFVESLCYPRRQSRSGAIVHPG
jgi:putative ABC transport system permease protein